MPLNGPPIPVDQTPESTRRHSIHQSETEYDRTPVNTAAPDIGGWTAGTVLLDQFRVIETLGTGGSGKVYHVEDIQTGIHYALKMPCISSIAGSLRQRLFFREIRNWMDLPPHPNLTGCRFFRTIQDHIAVFAEFVDGGSLDELINRQMIPDIRMILDIAIQIARGLEAAHASGVIHQDIKPGNILISTSGIAKITDFGLSRAHEILETAPLDLNLLQEPRTEPTVSRGIMTPSYCSIEQKERRSLDHRTDIWSYGLTILTMFTGPTWWKDGSAGQAILEKFKQTGPRNPYPPLPEPVRDVIATCLTIDPDDRWQSMREIIRRLTEIHSGLFGEEYPRKDVPVLIDRRDPVNTPVSLLPLAYRTPEEWLKKAVALSPVTAVSVKMNRKIPHKSRKGELLHDIETLEESLRLFGQVYGGGRRDLRDDIVYILLTIAQTHAAADNPAGAIHACDRAVDILEQAPGFGDPPPNLGLLADVLTLKGTMLAGMGDADGSMSAHGRAIDLSRVLLDAGQSSHASGRLVHACLSQSVSLGKTGRYAHAAEQAREAARMCGAYQNHMKPDDFQRLMAACRNSEANALQAAGQFEPAIGLYEEAARALERTARYDDTRKQEKLAVLSMNRASALVLAERFRDALEQAERAVHLLEKHIGELGRTEHHRDLAAALQHKAMALMGLDDLTAARSTIDRSIKIRERLYYTDGRAEVIHDLAMGLCSKGRILARSGNNEAALDVFRTCDELLQTGSVRSPDPINQVNRARCLRFRAEACMALERRDDALEALKLAIGILEEVVVREGHREFEWELKRIEDLMIQEH